MNRQFKGTPGPWQWVSGNHSYYHFLKSAGGTYIHSDGSACGEYSPDIDVNGPDAKLIAAAPELLEALRQLRDYVEDIRRDYIYETEGDDKHPMILAEVAINKALGEE